MADTLYDVVVVGGGNAALCAAMAAQENGARVLILEKAPEEKRGGNSNFTGGGFRVVHHGADDIRAIVPDLTDEEISKTDFGEYSRTGGGKATHGLKKGVGHTESDSA